MSTFERRYHLKKPLLVYALAICFIVAPVGNIIASMIGFGVDHWYTPHVAIRFIQNVSWLDRSWLLLTFMAGVALLYKRKWSWLFAIGALVLTSIFNFHYGMEFSSRLSHGTRFFPVLFMLSNVSVVAVLYHFRFPYLDRREAWWGSCPRYHCSFPIEASGITGTATNISKTGAFIELKSGSLEMGKVIQLKFGPISDVEAEVVHVAVGTAGGTVTGYGLEFSPSKGQLAEIKKLILGLASAPVH